MIIIRQKAFSRTEQKEFNSKAQKLLRRAHDFKNGATGGFSDIIIERSPNNEKEIVKNIIQLGRERNKYIPSGLSYGKQGRLSVHNSINQKVLDYGSLSAKSKFPGNNLKKDTREGYIKRGGKDNVYDHDVPPSNTAIKVKKDIMTDHSWTKSKYAD